MPCKVYRNRIVIKVTTIAKRFKCGIQQLLRPDGKQFAGEEASANNSSHLGFLILERIKKAGFFFLQDERRYIAEGCL